MQTINKNPELNADSIIDRFVERLENIESKFSYQELTLESLNETILSQQDHITQLKTQVQQLIARLKYSDSGENSPEQGLELPPHY